MPATIASTLFGTTPAGDAIRLFTLRVTADHEPEIGRASCRDRG